MIAVLILVLGRVMIDELESALQPSHWLVVGVETIFQVWVRSTDQCCCRRLGETVIEKGKRVSYRFGVTRRAAVYLSQGASGVVSGAVHDLMPIYTPGARKAIR